MVHHRQWQAIRFVLTGAIACLLVVWGIDGPHFAAAQNRIITAADQAYEQLPHIPRANTYRLAESGEVQEHNTLLYRLIAYHTRAKRRAPFFRFDWKLTLADYLGAYEDIVVDQYPTSSVLAENPLESDRAFIEQLNRQEREELVNTLVLVFGGQMPTPPQAPKPTVTEPEPPTQEVPSTPQPGDSRLLL